MNTEEKKIMKKNLLNHLEALQVISDDIHQRVDEDFGPNVDPYIGRDVNGNYIMLPIVLGRIQIFDALIRLEQL